MTDVNDDSFWWLIENGRETESCYLSPSYQSAINSCSCTTKQVIMQNMQIESLQTQTQKRHFSIRNTVVPDKPVFSKNVFYFINPWVSK